MQAYVALLRGINVGGNNKVPMAELKALAATLGWQNAKTYIASGNMTFAAEEADAAALQSAMKSAFGLDIPTLVYDRETFDALANSCPFDPEQGKHVHGFFCFSRPTVDQDALAQFKAESETLTASGQIVWLHAPDGIGRSKLVEKMHKVTTGTDTTARNLNTIRKLQEMLDQTADGC
ncbi:DUF1697 domain-containing protein [Marivivens donghaensis]|uniref:DUF1697 domain-containing protein n=1 Tax=Marivivens donghaensis TaxID=1699413 RepID=A0ABX0W1P9_9RHOB|nr:DUF1697 domain-containing protein [Marivivens donghaensis]NIY72852.1 DUF1697 domain-containing protein [Marivivens donghaensis]